MKSGRSAQQGDERRGHPPLKARNPAFAASDGKGKAVRAILDACLIQIGGNRAGVAAGADPEYLHQMRIGLRRLKCAIKMFDSLLPRRPLLDREIDWLAGALGQARDWQMLADSTLPRLMRCLPHASGLAPLHGDATRCADRERILANNIVSSRRYADLMLALKKWRNGDCLSAARKKSGPLDRLADQLLRQTRRKLRQRARQVVDAGDMDNTRQVDSPGRDSPGRGSPGRGSPESIASSEQAHGARQMGGAGAVADAERLHRLRVAAKTMRYSIEFFSSLYRPEKVRRLVKRLARLQDVLGGLNDAAVANGLLRQLASETPGLSAAAALASAELANRLAREVGQLKPRLPRLARCSL